MMSSFIASEKISKKTFEKVLRESSFEIGEHFRAVCAEASGKPAARIPVSYKDKPEQIIRTLTAYTRVGYEETRDLVSRFVTGLPYSEVLDRSSSTNNGGETMSAVSVTQRKPVKRLHVKSAAAELAVQKADPVQDELHAGLNKKYWKMVEELRPEDRALYLKYRNLSESQEQWLETMLHLGHDLMVRQDTMEAMDESTYGKSLVPTLASLYGITETPIYHAVRLVRAFTLDRLLSAINEMKLKGFRISLSHLRELNRLDSGDFDDQREAIFVSLVNGEFLASRAVADAVNTVLGREQKQVSMPTTVTQTTADISDPYVGSGDSEQGGDALEELAPPSEIAGLCNNCDGNVRVFMSKFEKWYSHLARWREDASIEALESVNIQAVAETVELLFGLLRTVQASALMLQEVVEISTETRAAAKEAAAREAKAVPNETPKARPSSRKAPVGGTLPVDAADQQLAGFKP